MAGVQWNGLMGHLRRIAVSSGRAAMTDAELLAAFRARRDELAFETLVRRHGPMVFGVCNRILAGRHDAEDAFQATFLVLVRKAHAIGRPELLANWLYGVASRTACKARAVLARRRFREQPLTDLHHPPAIDRDSSRELRAMLDQALGRLPEKYRVPLILCELQGQSRKQAAQTLGLPEGTLSSRLARGRQLLAELLSRRGVLPSAATLALNLAATRADAALPPLLLRSTVRAALAVAAGGKLGLNAFTQGAIQAMRTMKLKLAVAVLAGLALIAAVIRRADTAEQPVPDRASADKPAQPLKVAKRGPSVIVLWMSGGPSQLDTFDLKPGQANGGPFKEIATSVKDIRISEHLPKLARHMKDMVLIRSLTHREGDHGRGTYLMQTGYNVVPRLVPPAMGSVLAKELGSSKSKLPNFVRIAPIPFVDMPGAGYLARGHGPLVLRGSLKVPALEDFQAISPDRAEVWQKSLTEALDLSHEKAMVRQAYGDHAFGKHCLAARRLVERGVPVVEVVLGGWDTHQDNFAAVRKLSGRLDTAWSALMTDLKDRKLLDTTLIVWAGEFGRTPRINAGNGRDHWPQSFTAVLAGGGIKGGQVIGKTNVDGTAVAERAISVPELLATIYQAVGVDTTKRYPTSIAGLTLPIVDLKAEPIKEVLGNPPARAADKFQGLLDKAERLARLPAELLKAKRADGEIVDSLYTATLARLPTETEKSVAAKHLRSAKARDRVCRDLVWALVNTKEFMRLHSLQVGSEQARQFTDAVTNALKK
jgi:RNA polymerase sigma factor (sigma-70 family)